MSLEIETVFRNRAHGRGLLLSALRVLAAEFKRYFRRRAAHKALSHLNEEELRDIGLIRTGTGYRELKRDRLGTEYWD